MTLPLEIPGSQQSLKTRIVCPSPTFDFAPIKITFLAFEMLFQVNDPEDCFASKIVPLGKYYDLKTP